MNRILQKYIASVLILALLLSFCNPSSIARAADKSKGPALSDKHIELLEGDSYILSVLNLESNQTVVFKSSDKSVVTVSEDDDSAKVTATGIGVATITVKIKEKKFFFSRVVETLECDVLVGPPALSIKCKKSKISMSVGQTKKLSYSIKPSNTTEIPVFKSDSPTIVSVSNNGRIAAKKIGKATITISIANGNTSTCTVIVSEESDTETRE